MKIFTTKTNYKKTAFAFLAVLFFAITGFSQTQTVTYSTAGTYTWTAPCGVTSITVQAWGGGGAGGGSTSSTVKGGGGGAGGTYVSSVITVIPNNTYNLTIGSGASGANSTGSKGGSSWFNTTTTLLAPGGNGGAAPTGGTVAGGAGSTIGSVGTTQIAGTSGNNGTSSIGGAGGAGANSGGAGGTARGNGGGNGNNGSQPGGGGGGAFVNNGNNRSGGDGGDGEIIITYTGLPTYCTPSFDNTEPITFVSFAGINPPGINNSTSASTSSPDYESSCSSADVIPGNSYPIQVMGYTDIGGFFFSYTDYVTVFIDWNQDGDFNDANEKNYIGTLTNSTGTDGKVINANITVPVGASLGLTKMRVYKYWDGYFGGTYETDACADNTYGQAEDYAINVTTSCKQPTGASVTDGTNTSTTSLTVCTGTQVTLTQTGGTLGSGTWEWRTGSCTGTLAGTSSATNASLTLTPPVGTTTYYVHSTCGAAACASVTVVVKTPVTITLASGTKDFPACKNTNNASYVSYNLGAGGTGATITGLPTGLTYNATGSPVVISGTPTVTGTFTYTVTPTGNSPCVNTGITGTITVSQAPLTFAYTSPTVTYCTNALITPNAPVVTGGTPTSYTIITPLPNGLSLDASGNIIGTPTTASAAANYTIRATNGCGSTDAIVNITISSGSTVFNITPTGTQNVCTPFSGTTIGLDGSQNGISYRLYLNGNPIGAIMAGTGSALNFGNQTSAGTYTIHTTSGCITNMAGSLTINITTKPTTTFTYPSYS
jgi:hypothetical protein